MKALVALTLIFTLTAAAPAIASSVSSDGTTVHYFAASEGPHTRSVNHNVVVSNTEDEIRVTQVRGSVLRAGPGCTLVATRQGVSPAVTCPRAGVTRIVADFAENNDSLAVALTPSGPALVMNGGGGLLDSVDYSVGGGPVSVTLDGVPDDGRPGRGDNISTDVENAGGTGGDDTLVGNDAANRLDGGNGRDAITAGQGDDFIDAREYVDCGEGDSCPAPQRDVISCGDGRDTVDGDVTDEVAADCEVVIRANHVFLSDGPDRFWGFRPNLAITGGAGDDRISGLGNDQLEGNSGNDVLRAGPGGENSLRGGSGNDVVAGNDNEDYLAGGYGTDAISGRGGKDSIDGGAGRDRISGGAGNDRIVSRERRDERDRVSCGSGRDIVIADRNDVISRTCERVVRG